MKSYSRTAYPDGAAYSRAENRNRWEHMDDGKLWETLHAYEYHVRTRKNHGNATSDSFWNEYWRTGVLTLREELARRGWL